MYNFNKCANAERRTQPRRAAGVRLKPRRSPGVGCRDELGRVFINYLIWPLLLRILSKIEYGRKMKTMTK